MDVVYIGKCTDNLQVNIVVPSLCANEMSSFFLSDAMELIEDTLMTYVWNRGVWDMWFTAPNEITVLHSNKCLFLIKCTNRTTIL